MKKYLSLLCLILFVSAVEAKINMYEINSKSTYAHFSINCLGAKTVSGEFRQPTGNISYSKKEQKGKVAINFPTKELQTGNNGITNLLKGSDFFNVNQYSTVQFKSDNFQFNHLGNVIAIHGQLTMKGTTQPLTLTTDNFKCHNQSAYKKNKCNGQFHTVIDRTLWGMNKYQMLGVSKELSLTVFLETI